MVRLKCAVVDDLNTLGLTKPEADSEAYTKQRTTTWVALVGSVPWTVKQLKEAWEEVYLCEDEGEEHNIWEKGSASKLWQAILIKSTGDVTELAGPELQDRVLDLTWPTDGDLADQTKEVDGTTVHNTHHRWGGA